MTSLLAFDLMGTLLADPFREAHEVATARPMTELIARGLVEPYHDLECGRITEDGYWQRLEEAGVPVDVELFHAARRRGYVWLPGARELLVHWSGRVPTVVASNCPPWIESDRQRLFAGLAVDWYPSYRYGVRKPAAAFFEGLCARAGTVVDGLVLVDDKPANTAAVRELGGRAVTFITASGAARHLAALLTPAGDSC